MVRRMKVTAGFTNRKSDRVVYGDLEIGDRIHYSGDMANNGGWFIVEAAEPTHVDLMEEVSEHSEGRNFRHTPYNSIGKVYAGHCDPRFVTEAAYSAWYTETMAQYFKTA